MNLSPDNKFFKNDLPLVLSFSVVALMVVILHLQGRIWWCKFGDYAPYINDAWSPHTSQHLFDPYSFTHVLHGVLFFWLTSLIFRKASFGWRFFLAVFAESGWEVLENSNRIIEKYRENTASLDYFGDSVFNSFGDVLACGLGFWVAYKLGWRRSIIFFLLIEIALIFWIHDSLLINIIMLIHPIEAIKDWQIR